MDGKNCKVEYLLRCFIKVKSVFEIGQGLCVQFPIFIVNKPSEEASPLQQLDKSFKIQGLPREYEEGGDLEEGAHAHLKYARDAWSSVDAPTPVSFATMQEHREDNERIYVTRIRNDMSMGSLNMSKVIPIGFEVKNVAWPDYKGVNEPDWAEKNVQIDMNAWMQGSGFDGGDNDMINNQQAPDNQLSNSMTPSN